MELAARTERNRVQLSLHISFVKQPRTQRHLLAALMSSELCASSHPLQSRGCREDQGPASTRGPSREIIAQRARRPQVWAENTPAFPARLNGLLRALLGEPMLVCHRRLAQAFGACARLDASVGATRPRRPRLRRSSVGTFTSTASHPAFVTFASAPLQSRRDGGNIAEFVFL